MNRCHPRRALLALAAIALALPLAAFAQLAVQRDAPKDVTLGKMKMVAPPAIEIDGKAERLSPGSRIRDVRNMLVLSNNLAGQTVPVVFRREPATGLVHEVWLLTDDEYKQLAGTKPGSGGEGVQKFLELLAILWGKR